ncbi:MAG: CPBP family intramembrane metalloprotease [Deltaproteobacteria bacterium]|nr:CPBP family intramembrane metalloprotease [Deltaproteobacteria bacterium]
MASKRLGARAYLQQSREPLTAAVAVLPLFVVYQLGILFTGGVRNGVDFVTDLLFAAFGNSMTTYLGFNAVVLVGFVGAVLWLRRTGEVHPRLLPLMLVESAVYALLVGIVVNGLIHATGLSRLLQIQLAAAEASPGLVTKIVMSTGAGLYEEFAFRLVLMGGMFVALHRVGGQSRVVAASVALVVSSLIFSAVHHVGNMGEPFTLGAFVFRFFAGAVFAAIFHVRGFAIAAWTHALYDVWVMVFLDR